MQRILVSLLLVLALLHPGAAFAVNKTIAQYAHGTPANGQAFLLQIPGVDTTLNTSDDQYTYVLLSELTTFMTSSFTSTFQPVDAGLTSFATLGSAADKYAYTTGVNTWVEGSITSAGRAILDDAAASDQRTTLGLGTLATQSGTFSGTSSGTNTGDQTITLTSDVTGTGTGSFATTIANDAVTNAKAANMAANTIKGRITGSTGDPEDLTAANVKTILALASTDISDFTEAAQDAVGAMVGSTLTYTDGTPLLQVANDTSTQKVEVVKNSGAVVGTRKQINFIEGSNVTLTVADDAGNGQVDVTIASSGGGGGGLSDGDYGDITVSGTSTVLTIDADVVTYAKMQNISATDMLLGRSTAGAGNTEEIPCDSVCRGLLDDTSASAQRTTLGVAIGSNVQAYDADLTTYAGITPSANVQSLLGAADYAAMRTLLSLVVGTNVQAYDAELAALAGLTSAANKGIQFTGSGTAGTYDLTTAGKALLDDADAAAQRTTLGLRQEYCVAMSDQTTALSTGTTKATLYFPAAATVNSVRAYVNTAPTGSTIIVDINEAGSTLMTTTKLSIDASEKTSGTAAAAAALTDTAIAANAEITFDIDQKGSTIAGAGLVACMDVTF